MGGMEIWRRPCPGRRMFYGSGGLFGEVLGNLGADSSLDFVIGVFCPNPRKGIFQILPAIFYRFAEVAVYTGL